MIGMFPSDKISSPITIRFSYNSLRLLLSETFSAAMARLMLLWTYKVAKIYTKLIIKLLLKLRDYLKENVKSVLVGFRRKSPKTITTCRQLIFIEKKTFNKLPSTIDRDCTKVSLVKTAQGVARKIELFSFSRLKYSS